MEEGTPISIALTGMDPPVLIGMDPREIADRDGLAMLIGTWIVRGANSFNYQAVAEWQPDAIICQLHPDSKDLVQAIRASKVSKVELHTYIPSMKLPRVMVDTAALGVAAVDHFY